MVIIWACNYLNLKIMVKLTNYLLRSQTNSLFVYLNKYNYIAKSPMSVRVSYLVNLFVTNFRK